MQTRREFLKLFTKGVGCFAVAASVPYTPKRVIISQQRAVSFPQGLASGDPTSDSVVLWTRAVSADHETDDIFLTVQMSKSPDFGTVVAERECVASKESDFTVRVIVHDLEPDTRYYYRFMSGKNQTDILGRTCTAPSKENERQINVAFASCQSYEGGYYHSYRELIERDKKAEEKQKVDFVLHLGDFIYETLGYGSARKLPPFPSGGQRIGEDVEWAQTFAVTVDDYRHLYRHYLMDPDLKEARARWPFIVTWDDHEFTDDSWQGMATYQTPGTPSQKRKLAANQAWFEYISNLKRLFHKMQRILIIPRSKTRLLIPLIILDSVRRQIMLKLLNHLQFIGLFIGGVMSTLSLQIHVLIDRSIQFQVTLP